MDCPHCQGTNCVQKNSEVIRGHVVVMCSSCRKAWIDGDGHLVSLGENAIKQLRMRCGEIDSDLRWRRFMESDDDVLWTRVL